MIFGENVYLFVTVRLYLVVVAVVVVGEPSVRVAPTTAVNLHHFPAADIHLVISGETQQQHQHEAELGYGGNSTGTSVAYQEKESLSRTLTQFYRFE